MPKSTATYFGFAGSATSTKMLPGCMSAWKKLCRKTCVKKMVTPFSASLGMSVPSSLSRSTSEMGTPRMRSMTITSRRQSSQCTSGTCSSGEPSKFRLSWEALPASRIRSSSSRMVFSYSSTTSLGRRRLDSGQ